MDVKTGVAFSTCAASNRPMRKILSSAPTSISNMSIHPFVERDRARSIVVIVIDAIDQLLDQVNAESSGRTLRQRRGCVDGGHFGGEVEARRVEVGDAHHDLAV